MRAIREIENTNNERPLNLVKNSWGSTATDLGSEDQVVLAYIENLRLAKGSEAARRLQGTTPFKISRVELNKHFQGKPNIQHSYLILPNHNTAPSLHDFLKNTPGIKDNYDYMCSIATSLQQALSDLHAINITHNDLHDENIVVEFDVEKQAFKCQIIDFGLATDIFPDNKKLFQKDLRALEFIFQSCLQVQNPSNHVQQMPLSEFLKNIDLRKFGSEEIANICEGYKGSAERTTQHAESQAKKILEIFQANEKRLHRHKISTIFKTKKTPSPLEFNLQVLTTLPPNLYSACYKILQANNGHADVAIQQWTKDRKARTLFKKQPKTILGRKLGL